ncbi:hypothetical protein KCU81_g9257, partial [Aureobasidium melanogenum]|uniref:Uncharacterized protein n=1 Tax=Aureobasidium melanogenum (strain CBS 110374) TaxID=1043003 RepID=A0A074VK75_AURM1
MSTRQTRSKSRGRAANKPIRPLSRVRTNTSFSDPDYDQSTPEPKTASTPSPTWGKFPRKTAEPQGFRAPQGIPSVPLIRSDGRRYYMSSACGPVSYSPAGKFQDRVTSSNASRAKAMVLPNFPEPAIPWPNPNFPRRSASRPKHVEISRFDKDEEERLRASSTWRKKRPDTPSSARATMFDFPSKNSFWHPLEGFVPRSGFVWLVLIFLGILLGLSTPPQENPVQVAYKEVCSRFGNPVEWNCNGNFNFTIDNVVSHCHNAADAIYDNLHMAGVKTNVEDLVHTCQVSIEARKGKLEYMFEGMEKATANFKKSLCALPRAEKWDRCVKKSYSKLSKPFAMLGSVFRGPITSTGIRVPRPSKPSSPRLRESITIQEVVDSPANPIARVEHVANSVVASLAGQVKSHASSALSSVSSAYLPIIASAVSSDHTPEIMETVAASAGSNLSAGIEAVSKIKDVELKYTLAVAKAELKMLQQNDTSIVAHITDTKRHLNALLITAWELQKEIDQFSICMIRTSEIAISELSKTITYGPWTDSWFSLSRSGWMVTPADKAFKALSNPPVECQTFLVRIHQKVQGALETGKGLLKEIERVIELSYHRDFAKKSLLYVPVPLPWVRPLGPFPNFPVIRLPAIRWNPWYWFRDEAYWYRIRTQEQREQGLRLHRLRSTLHQLREATEGFDDIRNLLERAIVNLLDAHKDLESHREQVLQNPKFGVPFFLDKTQTVREDLAVAIKLRDGRKRVKNYINAEAWKRYNNGDDQRGVFVVKEMRL